MYKCSLLLKTNKPVEGVLKRWHSGTALAVLTDLDLGSVHPPGQLPAACNSSSHDIGPSAIICTQMCTSSNTDANTSLRMKYIFKKRTLSDTEL